MKTITLNDRVDNVLIAGTDQLRSSLQNLRVFRKIYFDADPSYVLGHHPLHSWVYYAVTDDGYILVADSHSGNANYRQLDWHFKLGQHVPPDLNKYA